MSVPPPCPGSGKPPSPFTAGDVHEVTCPECGHVVHVRTDRRLQRHLDPIPSDPAPAGKDT